MKNWTKEWCSITLFNRFNICLQMEFNIKQLDLVMCGFQLRQGIALTILGFTVGLEWKYNVPKPVKKSEDGTL